MQNLNVNITPDNYPQSLYYSQNDVGREFKINITDFTIPTGATVKIQATKPSGFGFSVAGTVSGNSVTFETTAEMTDEAGRFPAELVVTSGTDVIGTANFLMVGEMNPHPEGTTDGSQGTIIPELTLLVERVEAAASSVLDMQVVAQTLPAGSQASYSYDEDLNKATFGIPEGQAGAGAAGVVASAYSAAKTYKVGDYVLYNSNLYRCTTAITTAEAWTAAHWTQIVLADDVTDLKTDLDEITEATTTEGYDTDDNLCEGLSLVSGYYSTADLIDNANFSHIVVDVTGLEKIKIYGTHHTYTTSQFNQLGGFWDANNDYITGIVNAYGSLPSSLPYEVNVPNGATELRLNTDYKASDYPSSLPSGLAVYPWAILTDELKVPYSALEKMPVALEDLSDGGKKLKIIAGVIRNSGNGWEYINDSGHEPLNLTSVSVDANGKIEIDYGFTASKVLSLVATPDETFAGLYSIGGSVGLDKTLFNCYALPKVYGGMVRITNGVVDATSYASFTSAEIKTNGEIRLYHPTLSGMSSKEVFNIQASSPSYAIKLGSQGFDYVSLYAYDANGQKITDFTGLSFDIYATRNVNARFINANDIVDAGGNFWIYGVMEIA